jgi:cyclophilin family peptidyl-prolyl cis-trans isomerase
MPKRTRDRHLAKNAERRRQEKLRQQRTKRAAWGVGGGVLLVLLIVLAIGLLNRRQSEQEAASATPSVTAPATGKPQQTGTVGAAATPPEKVACGGARPAAADKPKLQFDIAPSPKQVLDPALAYTAVIETSCGSVRIALDSQGAPQTVASFVFLAEHGFFDGQFFFRIDPSIDVIQGGDPTGAGGGGPGYTIPDELTGKEKYAPGTIAMANGGPDTGGSQFFLIYGANGHNLDDVPNYTIFGHATDGMDVLKTIGAIPVQDPSAIDTQKPIEAIYVDKVTIETAKAPSASPSPSG